MSLFGSKSTQDTSERRKRLETLCEAVTVGMAHVLAVGDALAEIRDKELYLLDAGTFDGFVRDRWGMSGSHAGRLMMAAVVARELTPTGFVPTSERQIRPLTTLPAEERIGAWKEAATEADETGRVPSAAIARAVAKRVPAKASKTRKRLKPVRFRVPGARIEITPNAKFTTVEQAIRDALVVVTKPTVAKAA